MYCLGRCFLHLWSRKIIRFAHFIVWVAAVVAFIGENRNGKRVYSFSCNWIRTPFSAAQCTHTHTHVHAAAVSNGRVAPIVWLLCKVKVKPFLFRPFFWGYFLICREQCCVRCCASAAALFRPALHFSRSFDRPHIVWISFVQFKKITEKKGREEMWRFEK